ncbi:MAG: hypothetical protein HeimC3_53750 [Candidatus Heimdallarchaeota archaeon LC_3]|nr:MAG: hypothetical protein HeimC3_53750 [Candidatus Heimdallarchaeota archaeon LC_3]
MSDVYSINCFKVKLNKTQVALLEILPSMELSSQSFYFMVQTLRKQFSSQLFFIWNKKFLILKNFKENFFKDVNVDDLELLGIEGFSEGEEIILDLRDKQEENKIKAFLGQIIATQLRLSNYLVEQKGNYAFQATYPQKIENIGSIETWPGFEYQFLLEDEGIYFVLDPKHKLNWTHTLRDELKANSFVEEENYNKPIKDICQSRECPERIDPYYRCPLGGVGSIVFFKKLSNETPLEGFDVFDYLTENYCPTQKILEIIDKNHGPTAYASKKIGSVGIKYPLERLSLIPMLDLLQNRNDTIRLMKKLQPRPEIRYTLTENYYNALHHIFIENFDEIEFDWYFNFEENNIHLRQFAPNKIQFQHTIAETPTFIINNDPYQTISLSKIHVLSLMDEEIDFKTFKSYLFDDDNKFEGFFQLLEIAQCEIEKISEDTLENTEYDSAILVFLQNGAKKKKFEELKRKALLKSNFLQKITYERLKKNLVKINQTVAKNHLRNVSLAWLTKSGGIPYSIQSKEDISTSYYIGWVVNFSELHRGKVKQIRIALALYNGKGEIVKSIFQVCHRNEYSANIFQLLKQLIESLDKDKNNIVHILKEGMIYDNTEGKVIEKIKDELKEFNGEIIIINEGIFRIFKRIQTNRGLIHKRPKPGLCIKITENHFLLLTTSLKDREYNNVRTQQPISCIFTKKSDDDHKFSLLENLFHLTYSYHGSIQGLIKLPAPLYASRKIQQFFQNMDLENDFLFSSEIEYFV